MKTERIHWVDSLRGLAILLMIVFHFAFNLDYLEIRLIDLYSGIWLFIGNFVRFSFLSLVGVSLYLSYKKRKPYKTYLNHQLRRAIKLFLIAMGVTLITWLLFPVDYIRFGVLHLISVAILIGALLIRHPIIVLISILPILILGGAFCSFRLETSLFLPLGIMPYNFNTMDYFPIFPWLAVVFFGIVIAYVLDKLSLLINPKKLPRLQILEKIGQKSLIIYLAHQPILFGGLWLFTKL